MPFLKGVKITLGKALDSVTRFFDEDENGKASTYEVLNKVSTILTPASLKGTGLNPKESKPLSSVGASGAGPAQALVTKGVKELAIKPMLRAGATVATSIVKPKGGLAANTRNRDLFGQGYTGEEPGQVLSLQEQIKRSKAGLGDLGKVTGFLQKKAGINPAVSTVPLLALVTLSDLFPESPLKAAKALKSGKVLSKIAAGGDEALQIAKVLEEGGDVLKADPTVIKTIADAVSEETGLKPFQNVLEGTPVPEKTGQDVLNDFKNKIKYAIEDKTPKQTITGILTNQKDKLEKTFLNKYVAFDRLEKNVLKQAGVKRKGLSLSEAAEQFAGVAGKQQLAVRDFETKVVEPIKDVYENFNEYLALRRVFSRLESGRKEARVAGYTREQVLDGLKALRDNVGPETFGRIEGSANAFQEEAKKSLRLLQQAGIISGESVQAIEQSADFYAPFRVMEHVGDSVEEAAKTGANFKVSKDSVLQALKGIDDEAFELFDPTSTMSGKLIRVIAVAEKNKIMQRVGDLTKLDPDGTFIKKIVGADELIERQELKKALALSKPLRDGLEKMTKKLEKGLKLLLKEKNSLEKAGYKASQKAMDARPIAADITRPKSSVTIKRTSEWVKENAPKSFDELKNTYAIKGLLKNEYSSFDRLINETLEGGWDILTQVGIPESTAKSIAEQIFKKPTRFPATVEATQTFAIPSSQQVKELVNALITKQDAVVSRFAKSIDLREDKISNIIPELDGLRRGFQNIKNVRKAEFTELRSLINAENVARLAAKKDGKEIISYYEKGKKVFVAVNDDVAQAVAGFNQAQMNMFSRALDIGRKPFRFGAITGSAAYQVANILFADIPRNVIMNKFYGLRPEQLVQFPIDMVRGLYASMTMSLPSMTPNQLAREFLESGAANSTVARVLNPEAFIKANKTSLIKSFPKRFVTRTGNAISQISDIVESTSKLAGFQAGKRAAAKGRTTMEEVVKEVRRYAGSPDFGRGGTSSRDMSLIFMFFNARLQGTSADLSRLIPVAFDQGSKVPRLKGESLQAWAKLTAGVGVPTLALAAYNFKPENRADFEAIPQYERDNYFMIPKSLLYGKEDPRAYFTDEEGQKIRDYWKIQKREVVKLFAGLIESGYQFAIDKDPKLAGKFAAEFVEGISPINIEGKNLKERALSVVGSSNPIIKIPAETLYGISSFTKRKIIPEYIDGVRTADLMLSHPEQVYKESTPEVYVSIGKTLGMSPLIVENVINNFTGGLAGNFTFDPSITGSRENKNQGSLFRRFNRSPYTESTKDEKKTLDQVQEVTGNEATEDLLAARKVKDVWGLMQKAKSADEVLPLLQDLNDDEKEKLRNLIEREALGLNYTDREVKNLSSNEEKAEFVFMNLQTFSTAAQAEKFFSDMARLEIMTDGVKEELKKLMIESAE